MEENMNILKSLTIISLSASLLLAANETHTTKQNKHLKNVVQMGQKGSKLLLKTLGSNMKKNMKKGGPLQALDFCSNEAYNLTEKVNKQLPRGVRVKRVSLKFRNPANAPQADEAKILQALEKLQENNVILPRHLVEKVDGHVYKFYKPLFIKKKVCLQCHGNIKDTDLKRAIAERYPIDKAKHYKMNDLRGAVVVTIDTSAK
jgi:hypothetical protein